MREVVEQGSLDTASTFRSSAPVVCRKPRRSKTVFSGWNASGTKARNPPVLVLLLAQAQKMVDTFLVRLDVAVQHHAVRRDAEPVRGVVRVEPVVGMLLAGSDEKSGARGRRRSRLRRREGAEAGVAQLDQNLLVRQPRHVVVVDLGRRVALEVHVRHRRVQLRDRVDVEREVDVRVLSVDHVDLGEAGQLALPDRIVGQLVG